jgi:threonine-phosphate decarboxylase
VSEHRHGGLVFEAARDLGIPWQEILDFSANINPAGQPPGLKARLFEAFPQTVHYPETDAGSFVHAVSESVGIPEECVLPGAGSTPHIRMIVSMLNPKRPVIIGPAFAEYEQALETVHGANIRWVTAKRENDFLVTPADIEKASDIRPDLIFIANPANPTGRLLPKESVKELLRLGKHLSSWIVVDEAFMDFTPGVSLLNEAIKRQRLLVMRSLTKIYAIPGLRLAYLAGHPAIIARMRGLLEPWPLNVMALTAGLYSLPLKEYVDKARRDTARLRNMLKKVLSPWGRLIPSDANFMLMDAGDKAPVILDGLYRKGILVRDASNFRGLGPGWLRFAVRPLKEIRALGKALETLENPDAPKTEVTAEPSDASENPDSRES